MDGQPDAEFEIRYTRGNKLVQVVNLSMAAPNGQLCCQAWSTAGAQFHFLGVSTPTGVLANAMGFTPTLGYPPETLRLYAASPEWFTPRWNVVATVVFAEGTYISGSTMIGGALPFPVPGAELPPSGSTSLGPACHRSSERGQSRAATTRSPGRSPSRNSRPARSPEPSPAI